MDPATSPCLTCSARTLRRSSPGTATWCRGKTSTRPGRLHRLHGQRPGIVWDRWGVVRRGIETYKKAGEEEHKPAGDLAEMMGGSPEQDRQRLLFNDHVVQGDLYKAWKPFKHPSMVTSRLAAGSAEFPVAHPFMLPDLVHRNAAAVLFCRRTDARRDCVHPVFRTRGGRPVQGSRARRESWGLPSLPYTVVQKKLQPLDRLRVAGVGLTVVAGAC